MTHEQRVAAAKASKAKAEEVLRVGEERGIWKVGKTGGNETMIAATVFVNGYLPFLIQGGGWNAENKISAEVGGIELDGIKVDRHDLRVDSFEACISSSKTVDQIIKDIERRVTSNAQAVIGAARIHRALQDRLDARGALWGHVEALQKVGFNFPPLQKSQYLQVEGRRDAKTSISVYNTGHVVLDIATTVDKVACVIDKL